MRARRVLTLAAVSGLAAATIGIALGNNASADAGCGADTMRGAYALYATGTVSGIPLAATGRFTFDGAGHSTATMIESYDGLIDDGTLEGTYFLNSDCRGSLRYTMKHYKRGASHQAGQAHEYRHEVHTVDIVVASGGQRIFAVVVDTYPMAAPPGAPTTDDPINVIGWLERM